MKRTTIITLLVGLLMLSLLWQGYTLARLLSHSEPIVNAFRAPECTLIVTEEFDGTVKQNVELQTGGDVAQYLRMQIIPTVQDADGNTLAVPISLDDFTIEGFDESAWVQNGGYYYYKWPVQPNEAIAVFARAQVKTDFSAEQIPTLIISAQGIQTNAAQRVWGITLVDGVVSAGGQSE